MVSACAATWEVPTPRTGGLILFDIDAVEEAERLVAGDPFVRAEVLDSWQVKQWGPE